MNCLPLYPQLKQHHKAQNWTSSDRADAAVEIWHEQHDFPLYGGMGHPFWFSIANWTNPNTRTENKN